MGVEVWRTGSPTGLSYGCGDTHEQADPQDQIDLESKSPVSLDIDHPTLSPDPQVQSPTSPRSPTASESLWVSNDRARVALESQVYSSPAFLKRGRLSSASYLNSIYDPFLDEDEYLKAIRRKRTKFGRGSGQWRYTERTPSPDSESEADVHEGNQHGTLEFAGDKMETITSLEEDLDLQESETRERDIELRLKSSLAASVEDQTSDIIILESAVMAEHETTGNQSSPAAISVNHTVEGPGVGVSEQELPIGKPLAQRSMSAESLPVMRKKLLVAEEVEVVAEGATPKFVASRSPSQVDVIPDDHMQLADAQHVVPGLEPLFSQAESPCPPTSRLVSSDFDEKSRDASYISQLDRQLEQPLVSDNASDDDPLDTAAGAQKQSIATRSNQQEIFGLVVGTNTLNAKGTIPGVLPEVSQNHHDSDLATKDTPVDLDGGAFSQPTAEDISLGDRWDHVAAAHKKAENPEGGSESRKSPSSHPSDKSPIEIEDDLADLTAPSDGLDTSVYSDQQIGADSADNDVNEFIGSLALDNKSKRQLGSSPPKLSQVIDVEESFTSKGSLEEEEEDQENEYSEDEDDEREPEDENSEDWTEDSEVQSTPLEEYSSYASDEAKVEGQVPLVKPPIEIIDLDDDDEDEEAESLQGGLERPYDLPLPDILSTGLAGSVTSEMLETHGSPAEDILTKDIGSSRILVAADVLDESALPEASESSRVLAADDVRNEDVLSVASESPRVMIADDVHEEDALLVYSDSSEFLGLGEDRADDRAENVLSMSSEHSQDFEADEARGQDVLSMNSESSHLFEADEVPEQDVLTVDSEPAQLLVVDDALEQDVMSVDSEPSRVLEVVEDRGEDLLPLDGEPQQSGLFQAHQQAASTTSSELGVPSSVTDTLGRQVSLVEHQTVHLPVQEAQTETSQEVQVEIKQVIESLLPDTDVISGGPNLTPESDLRQHILDPRLRNHLVTPDATQPVHARSQLSSVILPSSHGSQDLLTPRPTQGSSPDSPQLDAPLYRQGSSLLEKLKELRTSSGNRSQVRSESEAASAITPWFTPKRLSQIVPEGASEDESDHSEDESDNSGLEGEHSDIESGLDSDRHKINEAAADDVENNQPEHIAMSTQPGSTPTGLRTSISYFAPLASLESHFGSTLDVIAIVVSSTRTSRAKTGPRDYHVTMHLADPSTTTSSSVHPTTISIFRPFKKALPLAQPGDAVLLRDFKVQRRKQRFMLLSTNSSAWAVFRTGEEAQIRGPPVEYGAAERGFIRGLRDWWGSLAAESKEELWNQAPKVKELDEGKGRWVDGKHELRDGTTYTDVPAEARNAIHELRDGTTYVDEDL